MLIGLDPDQREAVTVVGGPLAIIAAPGSGKTTVLTRRIAHRVAIDPDVHAQHVLALTFTAQAASELQRRLRRTGLRDRIEAGTFHAIALRLLRQRAVDNGQPTLNIVNDRMRLLDEAVRAVPFAVDPFVTMGEIDWSRARRVPYAEYAVAAKRAGRRTSLTSAQLSAVAEAYATVKRRRGVVDFDDLLEQTVYFMRTDRLWADGVRWRYRHLFVDEGQDLNPLQHAVLESIRDGRPDLCIVGDPRQAIFGFNGADPAIMNNVEDIYPGVTIVRLQRNYRCTPQIINAARTVLEHADQSDDSIAVTRDGPDVRVAEFANDDAENAGISRLVRDVVASNQSWRSCAVLARTVAQLNAVGDALTTAGVPINLQGRAGNERQLGNAIREATGKRGATELGDWIEAVMAEGAPGAIRTRVAEAADRYLAQSPGITFRAWVELHSPFDDLDEPEPDDAVDLLTFHASKGREWQRVFVIGAEYGLVPHTSAITPAQRDEEARLLYVACTRAREGLVVSWAARRKDRLSRPSPLIAGIAEAGAADAPAPPPMPRRPRALPDPIFVALVAWRSVAARAAQVDPSTICSDESLRAVAQARPTTAEGVAALTGLGPLAAARIAPRLLAALSRALEPPSEAPPTDPRPGSRASASVGRTPPASSR
ncbi:MAG: uvrD2 [Ilumatobacteraceae bacterium]|nr:uvrD2 [Ilumatobacteraceae bacterium]